MGSKGQTTFDFAVGITFFLLVVGFAFTTVPGFLAPYEGGGESEALLADRTAVTLGSERLAYEGERYELDPTAVDSFFGLSVADAKSDLGVAERYGLNVTLELDSGTCPGSATDTCTLGDAPPEDATVARSRRVVSVDGTRGDLTVRVWT